MLISSCFVQAVRDGDYILQESSCCCGLFCWTTRIYSPEWLHVKIAKALGSATVGLVTTAKNLTTNFFGTSKKIPKNFVMRSLGSSTTYLMYAAKSHPAVAKVAVGSAATLAVSCVAYRYLRHRTPAIAQAAQAQLTVLPEGPVLVDNETGQPPVQATQKSV